LEEPRHDDEAFGVADLPGDAAVEPHRVDPVERDVQISGALTYQDEPGVEELCGPPGPVSEAEARDALEPLACEGRADVDALEGRCALRPELRRGDGELADDARGAFLPTSPPAKHREQDQHGQDDERRRRDPEVDHAPASARRASRWVGRPRRNVARTAPGSSRPRNGLFGLAVVCAAGSIVRRAAGSTSVRFAGSPTATGRPCRWSTRPIRAGVVDMTRATSAHVRRPVSTIAACTTLRAVSRPVMPKAAATHSQSLSSTGCGAWSVATMSIVPSASPARTASTSACVRSGGLTLKTAS